MPLTYRHGKGVKVKKKNVCKIYKDENYYIKA